MPDARLYKALASQIYHLTIANMKSRYRKTIAGFIWVVMSPIMMYGAQSLAFRQFLRLDIPDFFIYLLSGLLPWIFITQTASMSAPLLLSSGNLLKSMQIHPLVVLMSQVIDNFFNFMFAFVILFIPIYWAESVDLRGLLLLPVGLGILVLGVAGMCWFLSVLNIFFRDVQYIVSFLVSVMFFITPVFYPVSYVPEKYRWMVDCNPFYGLIRPVRSTLYQLDMANVLESFGVGAAWALGFLLLAAYYWKRKKNMFYHYV